MLINKISNNFAKEEFGGEIACSWPVLQDLYKLL
jgi:hypothetical protein